jgi:tRNA threonylcarbamoyl adenosine modification protein YeaZ
MILGFNFATENLCLAIADAEKIYRGQTIKAEFLPEYLDELLKESNLTLQDISRIGIAIGPGAFTGLRLSLVTAKTLALELNIPLVPVSTLEALAVQYQAKAQGKNMRVIMDACRGESATALFDKNLLRLEPDHTVKTADAPREKENFVIENQPPDAKSVCTLAARADKLLSRAEILALAPAYSHGSRVNLTNKPELKHLKIARP